MPLHTGSHHIPREHRTCSHPWLKGHHGGAVADKVRQRVDHHSTLAALLALSVDIQPQFESPPVCPRGLERLGDGQERVIPFGHRPRHALLFGGALLCTGGHINGNTVASDVRLHDFVIVRESDILGPCANDNSQLDFVVGLPNHRTGDHHWLPGVCIRRRGFEEDDGLGVLGLDVCPDHRVHVRQFTDVVFVVFRHGHALAARPQQAAARGQISA
mmetsp:Transcript_76281/g.134652  ORF Transcript_76281/g.134652 Transcript_76281/m.134652 type:complete len:216 (-) Transcript_76281:521-1168(-)